MVVPLGSLRHRPHCLRIPVLDRMRAAVLRLLVLCPWPEHFRILRWQRFLRHRKSSIST